MKVDGDTITFSSGRDMYAPDGIIGINQELELSYGYDGSIDWPVSDWWKEEQSKDIAGKILTASDMAELADFMIELWTKFKSGLSK